MRFILAPISDFNRVGIPITTERQFNGQAIKHIELLSTEELNKVDGSFQFADKVPETWNE
jgi:hypothetical protein